MVSEENLHPVINGEKTSFESFLPFVKVSDPKLKEWFTGKLKELYEIDGNTWRPGGCYATENMKADIENAQNEGKLKGVIFEARNWASEHYFMVFKRNRKELIVDPFGVLFDGEDFYENKRVISPYFGEIELAPEGHQSIYKNAKKEKIFHHMAI